MERMLSNKTVPISNKLDALATDVDTAIKTMSELRIEFDNHVEDTKSRFSAIEDRIAFLESMEKRLEALESKPVEPASQTTNSSDEESPGEIAKKIIFGGLGRKMATEQQTLITEVLKKAGVTNGKIETRGKRIATIFVRFDSSTARWDALRKINAIKGSANLLPAGSWVKPCQPREERERVRPISRGVWLAKRVLQALGCSGDVDVEGCYKVGAEGLNFTTTGWSSEMRLANVAKDSDAPPYELNFLEAHATLHPGFLDKFKELFDEKNGTSGTPS